ncbi:MULTISPECIES: neuraminidase-like domain-containing protein [Pseudomonas]|uniref:Tc toxin subunit A-related protein n=1 Tax=Pseudomonas TaxID=286 RepID=UPI00070BD876|nr:MULTISPECIES: neuraminidase-like domain-containing protein [Pseudomonas]KQW30035.1 toxin [Pseudomonas sp. Root401]WHS54432.1 neuraminidase-like domain-containing protein [Pseudomonas brassicacearum]
MTVAMKKQLDESLRDAQLALYLDKVAPDNDPTGTVRLKTPRDLYEYWLLDVLVSQNVPTTPVACAIASLQQYINRILMNMEPGYDQASITPEHLQTWRNEMHQYPIWAAHQKLLYFPASYLDPALRNNKSDNFQQLENDLNQSRIQADAVQSAVMAYLTRFEEIANLNILNGYIDGEDFANSTYYFIAKSRSENTYFWRSLDMAQRPLDGTPPASPAIAAKRDQPDPDAWSDWEKADVPIPESAVEHTIRPVWFNNRLFVVWAECIHQDQSISSAPSSDAAVQPSTRHSLLRLSFCFKKQDGKWSTPRIGLQGYCDDKMLRGRDLDAIKSSVGTVAKQHNNGTHCVLLITLCAGGSKTDATNEVGNDFAFNRTICIDNNLVTTSPTITEKGLIGAVNQRIQTKVLSKIEIAEAPLSRDMSILISDFESLQDRINIRPNNDRTASTLTLRMTASIDLNRVGVHTTPEKIRLRLTTRPDQSPRLQLDLVLPARSLPDASYVALDAGSQLTITNHTSLSPNPYQLSIDRMVDVLKDSEHSRGVTLHADTNLQGKVISIEAVRHLIKESRRGNNSSISGKVRKVTMQASNVTALDLGQAVVNLDEPFNLQYVIFRQPTTLATQGPSFKSLTVVAESNPASTLTEPFEFTWHSKDLSYDGDTFLCGVAFVYPDEPETKLYSALKAIKLNCIPTHLQAPGITPSSTAGLGTTQFIDFTHSVIKTSDAGDQLRQPIRLNTTFAAELIRRTENSLDELFDWTTQHLPEPAIPDSTHNRMDFHGPYGRYFTELFLYLPWLVAQRLNAEQRYEEAERWLRRVFDPGRGTESCWKAVPLLDNSTPSYADRAPHDPHQIALSHPAHFRKALYFLYLDILINRGDAAYRELTPDGLSEAKLWYVRVLDLLGPRPTVQSVDHWVSLSLQTLSETTSDDLRTFERSLARSLPSLPVRGGSLHASWPAIDSPHLRLPFNPQLLQCWDIAESRLYNLRHNLDIAGKPLHLPVFTVPLDPRALLGSPVLNTSDNTVRGLPSASIPHYRFSVMHSQALSAVDSLSQLGASLLSLIEHKEQAQLQELQQQQVWDLAKISVDLQRQALNIDRQQHQALLASQAIVQSRIDHYKMLLEKDVSPNERLATQFQLASGTAEIVATACQIAAGGLMVIPNIAGFSFGGSRWEGPMLSASASAHSAAITSRMAAENIDRTESFNRRRDEWIQGHNQAQLELAQIDAQLAHFNEQQTATRLQLRLAETGLSQAKSHYDVLSKRFTKTQLYQWLNSRFAQFYRQAYDTTLALCLAAETCWQYEIADFATRFIQPGAWNTTYRGLGAGEQLKLSLLNMQAGYLRCSERELEIRKTISLRQLKDQTPTSTINKPWLDMHADLKKGQCTFELPHELFDADYKDQKHYLRRIKTISVSLPVVVAPYENIRATLTQTSSKVFMAPDDPRQVMEDRRANQQIALSTGVDDNGLFTLNFNDERYLPFEYTGAASTWQLTFPNPQAQKDLLESLSDVIVHVSYTARAAGGAQ